MTRSDPNGPLSPSSDPTPSPAADPSSPAVPGALLGLVIVTHGNLAREFVSALEHVVGPQAQIRTVCIEPDDDINLRRADILQGVQDADAGRGVIVLTDMFGGTPSNIAISIMRPGRVEVIAGVNLPMLIQLAKRRATEPLDKAVALAQEAGRKYITVASQYVNR